MKFEVRINAVEERRSKEGERALAVTLMETPSEFMASVFWELYLRHTDIAEQDLVAKPLRVGEICDFHLSGIRPSANPSGRVNCSGTLYRKSPAPAGQSPK